VPLIIVPLPSAAENHQFHNARAVEAAVPGSW
jgi:UDP-N-acetylglucosamine:LPS N-acetylglucosamine transferase